MSQGNTERAMDLERCSTRRLELNAVANLVGKGWTAFASILFVPFYISQLGAEAYGLIGFHAVLQGILAVADMGLGATLNREMARLSGIPGRAKEMRDLLRTLETVFWLGAAFIALLIIVLAPTIARQWVNPTGISPETVDRSVRLMGIAIALQFPWGLYQGGLMGLQRQVAANAILTLMTTLRTAGAIVVLLLISRSVEAYFTCQVLVSMLQVAIAGWTLWRSLATSKESPRFHSAVFRRIWQYAAGMTGIALLSTLLMQMDKIVVGKSLSLEVFGYYSLASTVAQVPMLLSAPISYAAFPRLTQLVTVNDRTALSALYHRACRWVSVLTFPFGLAIAAFSKEIMTVWTGSAFTAAETSPLISLLIVGSIGLALQVVPYALALANGWTRLNLAAGLVSVILAAPTLLVFVSRYGAPGACLVWVLLNCGLTPVYIAVLHRHLLPGEQRTWYLNDVGLPLLAALLPIALGRLFIPSLSSAPVQIFWICAAGLVSIILAGLSTPDTRRIMLRRTQ